MTKSGVIRCILSLLLMAYLVVALSFTSKWEADDTYKGLIINIIEHDTTNFVTTADIDHELGELSHRISSMRIPELNTLKIEKQILAMDNIEDANCVVLNNGMVRLDVTPLIPVARVFDSTSGTNYYINRQGKRMRASTRYRIDVPIISGAFNAKHQPTDALPVIEYANRDPNWCKMASSYKMTSKGDIIIVPMVKGHVINFGDSTAIENKFDRLNVFYREVLPVKGWEYYDTITVKWRGQVVAKRHQNEVKPDLAAVDDEDYIDDPGTMLDNVITPEQ